MTKVAKKICEVMKKVEYLQKDGRVEFGRTRYSFLSEEKITTETRKAMAEVGLILYPINMEILDKEEITTKNGTARAFAIKVTYRIQDTESEEYIDVQALGEGMDSGDKALNKAMTGAFKYAQRQSFMIPTGDDPDYISSDEMINSSAAAPQKNKSNNTITEAQARRMFAIAKDPKIVKEILDTFGYKSSTNVEKDKYDDVCKAIERVVALAKKAREKGGEDSTLPKCADCKAELSNAEVDWCTEKGFNGLYCRNCQPKHKPQGA